jgi:hypothetical protein
LGDVDVGLLDLAGEEEVGQLDGQGGDGPDVRHDTLDIHLDALLVRLEPEDVCEKLRVLFYLQVLLGKLPDLQLVG